MKPNKKHIIDMNEAEFIIAFLLHLAAETRQEPAFDKRVVCGMPLCLN